MKTLKDLLAANRKWADSIQKEDPDFFNKLSHQQSPEYLWIGCSDSRVPANQIIGLLPGQIFVHRNVANLVVHTDLNCLSVLQYAVDVLRVKHVIVCGHYGCGGVRAVLDGGELGLIDNWLRHVKDVYEKHENFLTSLQDETRKLDRLCELNVAEQVYNICSTTIVQGAWKRGQELSIHGWIYRLTNGIINDLSICMTSPSEVSSVYRAGLAGILKT
jgi:carbonic anhydrase